MSSQHGGNLKLVRPATFTVIATGKRPRRQSMTLKGFSVGIHRLKNNCTYSDIKGNFMVRIQSPIVRTGARLLEKSEIANPFTILFVRAES